MNQEIRNALGERIAYDWTDGRNAAGDPVVVIGHGLTSDKVRPWSVARSEALREAGIASMRIAFSGNGDSEGRFEDSCITKEVEDLGAVLDALGSRTVFYAGHSMGGAVGITRASRDPRIRALVSLAAMTHTGEFFTRMFGTLEVGAPLLDKPHCPLSETLRSDLLGIDSVEPLATSIEIPWRIVHGTADDVVPVGHSRDLHRASEGRSELVELEDVDHSFTDEGAAAMIDAVVPWIRRRVDPTDQ